MTKICKSKLLRILTIATVLVAASVAFVFAADPTDVTGYHLVYRPLYDYIDTFLQPVCVLLVAVGSVYAIALGVKFAKAEEPQEREKTKVAIKNLIIGFISVFVIYAVWQLLMNLVIAPYAVSQTNNLDQDRVNVSVEGDDLSNNNYLNYDDNDYQSIKESRAAASDENAAGPTSDMRESGNDEELPLPGEESTPSYDPNTSSSQVDPNSSGSTPEPEASEEIDYYAQYITLVNTAKNNMKKGVNTAGSTKDSLSKLYDDLQSAISSLEGAIAQYGSDDVANATLADAKSILEEAKVIIDNM